MVNSSFFYKFAINQNNKIMKNINEFLKTVLEHDGQLQKNYFKTFTSDDFKIKSSDSIDAKEAKRLASITLQDAPNIKENTLENIEEFLEK